MKTAQLGKRKYCWVIFSSAQMPVPPFACQFAPGKSKRSLPSRMFVFTYDHYRCTSWQSAGSGRWGGIITSHEYTACCLPVSCERYMQSVPVYSLLSWFPSCVMRWFSSWFSEVPAHSNAIFDISWLPGGEQLVGHAWQVPHYSIVLLHVYIMCVFNYQMTASGDTSVVHWDVVSGKSIATYKYHTGSVKTVDVKYDEPSRSYSTVYVLHVWIIIYKNYRCICIWRTGRQHFYLGHKMLV